MSDFKMGPTAWVVGPHGPLSRNRTFDPSFIVFVSLPCYLSHTRLVAQYSTLTMPLQYQPSARFQHSEGHQDGITVLTFSPNGLLLASGGLDGRVCIWDMGNLKLQHVFSGKSAVLSLSWLEQSNEHLVCGMDDGTIASLTLFVVCYGDSLRLYC